MFPCFDIVTLFNSLLGGKLLDLSKFKQLHLTNSPFPKLPFIKRKQDGENAGYQMAYLKGPKTRHYIVNVRFGSTMRCLLWNKVKHCGKRRKCWLLEFSPFYTPIEDRTYYGITCGGRAGSSLSGAYLQST